MGQMNYVKCKVVRSYTAVIKKKLYKVKTDPGVANTRGKKACSLRPSKLGARAGVWGSRLLGTLCGDSVVPKSLP